MPLMQITLRGEPGAIEDIENLLRGETEFQILEDYRENFYISLETGVVTKQPSCRLVFGARETGTLRIFVREPGEMCIRVEGNKQEVLDLLSILPIVELDVPIRSYFS